MGLTAHVWRAEPHAGEAVGGGRIRLDPAKRNEAAVSLDTSFGFAYHAYEGGNQIFLRLWL